jgi:iron(III) transport system substrate-binding protein
MVQQPEFGWDYYEQLAANGAVAGQGNGTVIEAVARGEKAYGIIIEYMAFNAKKQGSPVEFVFPEEGVSAISQPVAVLKSSDNIEAAKTFVDWQLSQAAQEQSVSQGYFPLAEDVAPPEGYPPVDSLKILPTDNAAILENDEENKKRFADLFGG